jgi:hypothetical protein
MPSRCILYDRLNEKVYVGYFERPGKKGDGRYDERSMTAHEKMARAAKIEKLQCIGASISTYDGERTYTLNLNSNTINAAWGTRRADGREFRPATEMLENGDYYTVSENGSINRGTTSFEISHFVQGS